MLKVNYQNIYYFLKVAEKLNFTSAAKELYISQPALSKQIRQLEGEINLSLLSRKSKGVELTEGGKIMYKAWTEIMKITDEAMKEASKANRLIREKLRIGILEMGGVIDQIVPLVNEFKQENPEIETETFAYGFVELRNKLKKHELDIAFTLSSEIPSYRENIAFRVLKELKPYIIVSETCDLYYRENVDIQDLQNRNLYVLENSYSEEARSSIMEHLRRKQVVPKSMKTFPNLTSLMIGLSTGDGATIGYREFISENVEEKVRFFPLKDQVGLYYLAVAWDNEESANIRKFIKRF